MKPIILASASPRRRELLALAGYEFQVQASDVEETVTKTLPSEIVQELSQQKAAAVAALQSKDCLVIGSDTLVAFENEVMGKPTDREDAIHMITKLSGNTHQVYSGVTILEISNGTISRSRTFAECTNVHVVPMEPDEIASYVDCGECKDKAGAYGIQGKFGVYISGIDGDYYNVVGLPISRLHKELKFFL
ncbi:MAG: septum formation protein Maf [Lachnospiraceae bacterium]|nr:septum formation protein Maf [Lachnospiraceae bacterium]